MRNKRGEIDHSVLIQIILIGLVLAMFVFSTASKVNNRGVRQDIIESQVAMFIDAGVPGMSFEIYKLNTNGLIGDVNLEKGTILISLDGLSSFRGKPYFSQYDVKVLKEPNKFVVVIS